MMFFENQILLNFTPCLLRLVLKPPMIEQLLCNMNRQCDRYMLRDIHV